MKRTIARSVSLSTSAALLAAMLLVVREGEAHAYLDAGTGSILFQVLAGAVLASLFAVKVFWQRVKYFVATTVLRRSPERADDDLD